MEKRTKPTQLGFDNPAQRQERFMAVPSAFKPRSAELAVVSRQYPVHSPYSSTAPYLLQWLRSGKNLDFCLLAICSCILTVLCHHTSVLPSSAAGSSASTTPIANLSSIDFTVKAGLFTRSLEGDEEMGIAED